MPEPVALLRRRAPVRLLFQAENCLLESAIPFQGRVGILSVDLHVDEGEIALGAGGEVNDVCHAWLQIPRKTLSLAGPYLVLRPPGPDGFPPRDRHGRQCRAGADRLRRPARRPPPCPSRSGPRGAWFA